MRGEPIIVTSPGGPTEGYDEQGAPLTSAPTQRTINGVAVAPKGSNETDQTFGQKTLTGYTLYLPSGEVLLPTDRITIRGVTGWQVDGDSGQWTSPFTGKGKGVEVAVKRVG